MRTCSPGFLLSLVLCLTPALADEMRTETVRFPAGATGTVIEGSISGRESVLYKVGANAGQFMTVSLQSSNTATYFNVYAPGRGPGDEALAVGSQTGDYMPDLNRFEGPLPVTGEYTISVYLFRNAARRGERSNYDLDIRINAGDYADGFSGGPDYWEVTGVPANDLLNLRANPGTSGEILARLPNGTPLRNNGCESVGGQNWCRVETVDGSAITGWVANRYLMESAYSPGAGQAVANDAERAGNGDFDATGTVPCAQYSGQPMAQCDFGVARAGGGTATVVVTKPDGSKRAIFFVDGRAASADTSQADGYGEFNSSLEADLHMIQVGEERYEIPDAVVSGG